MPEKRKIVVTSALPYANGDIHLGHLVEYVQTDFWVRFQKLRGNECVYICADDTHGTPIMIRARKEGIAPEELIARSHATHLRDFTDFQIAFDNYYSTNSPENKSLSEQIYAAAEKQGFITKKTTPQLYCEHCKMFLPDRFVKGTCPKCGATGQYGDSCDHCGATYGAEELGSPVCTTCGATPVVKDSEHLYFELEPQHDYLEKWIPEHTTSDVSNKLLEWFKEPLRGWCISRDAPYFGFEIPGYRDKYFYVWVDAPIGYIASLANWTAKQAISGESAISGETKDEGVRQEARDMTSSGLASPASGLMSQVSGSSLTPQVSRPDDPGSSLASQVSRPDVTLWQDPGAELYHFIGKDIIRFHCLFWPGMLHSAGFKTPNKVFVHGFLTVNGEKMSKSKGTFVNARTYLDNLPPEALRYYYAAKLGGTTDDMDLNLTDFVQRVNSDLVGKITNIASRSAQMLQKKLEGKLAILGDGAAKQGDGSAKQGETKDEGVRQETRDVTSSGLASPASGLMSQVSCPPASEELSLLKQLRDAGDTIANFYEERRFNQVVVEICRLADLANAYFDKKEPWKTVKTDAEATRVTLTAALNAFRILAIYLQPILPVYAEKAMKLFGEASWTWDSRLATIEGVTLGAYEYLASRIDQKQVDAMVAAATVKPADSGEVAHESRASKNKTKDEGVRQEARDATASSGLASSGSCLASQVSRPAAAGSCLASQVSCPPLKPEIAFPDFEKLDLRVGVVESCEIVPKSSKLLKFVLDAGALGKRTIFSGIRGAYPDPAALVGREVVFVANLAPRKMSVGVSEGMILYAGEPGVSGGVLTPAAAAGAGAAAT